MLRQIRWVLVFLPVGAVLAAIGGGFSLANPTFISGSGLILGMVFVLLGLALKSAELSPVPIQTPETAELEALRSQATPTQVQILQDVTRYQYGHSVHLEPALERLGITSEENEHPRLVGIREAVVNQAYGLVLEFWSPDFSIEQWQEKEDLMTRFFGPGVQVQTKAVSQEKVELAIVTA
ncbi:MAG: DUF2854 domain-containing protein [Synechococcales bacterium]|nr:DUF2854 domain-containing protein [Synechococcales bacterium]